MKKRFLQLSIVLLVSALFGLTACEENSDSVQAGKGKLVVKLTDAPFPTDLIDQALITIDKIEIRLTDNASEGSNDGFIVLSQETQQFNLLDLQNGMTADLLALNIDTGKYDMVRVHVSESQIILKDGTSFKLKVPSGATSGLKIQIAPALEVVSGLTSQVLLDFDVSKSFVIQGNIKVNKGISGFIFKPVVRAVCQQISVNISGTVLDSIGAPVAEAYIKLIQGDSIYTSALTNEAGQYALIGIPAGTYNMDCEKEGFVAQDSVEVQVADKQTTIQNFELIKE